EFSSGHRPHLSKYRSQPCSKWQPPVKGFMSCNVHITGIPLEIYENNLLDSAKRATQCRSTISLAGNCRFNSIGLTPWSLLKYGAPDENTGLRFPANIRSAKACS